MNKPRNIFLFSTVGVITGSGLDFSERNFLRLEISVKIVGFNEFQLSLSGGGVIFRIGSTVWDSAGPFASPNARNNTNTLVTKYYYELLISKYSNSNRPV